MGIIRAYANPYFTCDECGRWITGHTEHSSARWINVPCGHAADSHSACPSWGPVDGCGCKPPKPHGEPESLTLHVQTRGPRQLF